MRNRGENPEVASARSTALNTRRSTVAELRITYAVMLAHGGNLHRRIFFASMLNLTGRAACVRCTTSFLKHTGRISTARRI
eukprot:1153702-Pelagomonas_calceolata.AAC.10